VPPRLYNILDPTSDTPGPIEVDQTAVQSMTSDQNPSESAVRQLVGTGGGVKPRLYIQGNMISELKSRVLLNVVRLRISMCNRWIRPFVPQLDQTCNFWVRSRGGEGFVAGNGRATDMEAAVAC